VTLRVTKSMMFRR